MGERADDPRRARLKAALRENLKRRKAQASAGDRPRGAEPDPQESDPGRDATAR